MASAENLPETGTDAFPTAALQGAGVTPAISGTATINSGGVGGGNGTPGSGGVYLNVLNADGSVGTLFLDTSQLNIQQREEGFFEITAALVAASPETNSYHACRITPTGREEKDDATSVVFAGAGHGSATGAGATTAVISSSAVVGVPSSNANGITSVSTTGASGDTSSSIRFITAGNPVEIISTNPDAAGEAVGSSNVVHINALGQAIDISGERDEELSETFRCSICSLEFSSECRLQLHLKSHFREKPHKCDSCEQAFNHEVNLILHRTAAHPSGGSTLSCPVCHKRFLRQASLKSHASVHLKDEFFVCSHCEAECDTQEELNYHFQMLHTTRDAGGEHSGMRGPRLMRCFTCRKSFASKEEFTAHRLHHQKMKSALRSNRKVGGRGGVKSKKDSDAASENKSKGRLGRANRPMHECPTCSKTFSKASLLARHTTIHTGEKKFACKVCDRRFTQEVTVRAHMAVHTGERPFECPFCEVRFSQKSNLRAHVARLHPMGRPERKLECPVCPCVFGTSTALGCHISKRHQQIAITESGTPGVSTEESGTPVQPRATLAQGDDGQQTNSVDTKNDQMHVETKRVRGTSRTGRDDAGQAPTKATAAAAEEEEDEGDGAREDDEEPQSGLRDDDDDDDNEEKAKVNAEKINCDEPKNSSATVVDSESSGVPVESSRAATDNDQQKDQDECQIRMAPLTDVHTGEVWEHVVRRAGGRAFHQCMFCSREFRRPSDLVRHIRMHTQSRPFKCHECRRTFSLKSSLCAHMRTHGDTSKIAVGTVSSVSDIGASETGRAVQCPFCSRSFGSEQDCKTHMAVHGVAASDIYTQYRCRQCETLVFESKELLAAHVEEVHGELLVESTELLPMQEPIMISETVITQSSAGTNELEDTTSVNGPSLNAASSIAAEAGATPVEGRRPFSCNICGYKFKKSSHLKQHLRSHTGEKPFQCEECLKSFTSRSILKAHIRTHSGLKEFHCLKCSASFTTRGSLRRHQESHKESSSTIADGQDETGGKEDNTNLQQRDVGEDNTGESGPSESAPAKDSRAYVCPYCEKRFRSNGAARKHIETSHSTESTIQVFREEVLRDRIIQEGTQEVQRDEDTEEPGAPVEEEDPQTEQHQQTIQLSQCSPIVPATSGTVQQSTRGGQVRRTRDSVVQLHIIADPDNPPTHQVAGRELFGVSALGPGGTLIQLVSRGDDGTHVLMDASGPNIARASTGDPTVSEQISVAGAATPTITANAGGTRLTLAGITDDGLLTETFTIPCEGIDVSALASQLGTTDEGMTLLLQQNNIIESGVQNSSNSRMANHTGQQHDQADCGDEQQQEQQRTSNSAAVAVGGVGGGDDDQLGQDGSSSADAQTADTEQHCGQPQDSSQHEILIAHKDATGVEDVVSTENVQVSDGLPSSNDGIINYRCSVCGKIFVSSRHLVTHLRNCQGDESSGERAGQGPDTTPAEATYTILTCPNCGAEAESEPALRDHVKMEHGVAALRSLVRQLAREKLRLSGGRKLSNRESATQGASGSSITTEGVQLIQIEATEELAKKNPRETTSLFERALIASANDAKRTHLLGEENRRSPAVAAPGQQLHKCPNCGREFKKNSDLVRHIRTHTGERPYSCTICGKAFTVKSSLDVHTRTHSGLRQYPCEVCSRGFATMGSLIVHMRLHTGARPFACSFCPARFRTSGHRIMHLRQHVRENPSLEDQLVVRRQQEQALTGSGAVQGGIAVGTTAVQLQMTAADGSSLFAAGGPIDSGRRLIAINPDGNEEYELLELDELLAANSSLAEQLQQQGTLSLALSAAPGEQEMIFERDQSATSDLTSGTISDTSASMPSVLILQCPQPNCSAAFTRETMLQRHLMSKHGMKMQPSSADSGTLVRYKCGVCDQSFVTQEETVEHMRAEHGVLATTEGQAE